MTDELFNVHAFGIAVLHKRLYGTPYIIFCTTWMLNSDYSTASLGRCPVCRMSFYTSSTEDLSYEPAKFFHRLRNAFDNINEFIGMQLLPELGLTHLKHLGVPDFSWQEYFAGSSAILSDWPDKIGFPLPEGTEMASVGNTCPNVNSSLPADIERFMRSRNSKGVIYAAFGTHVAWDKAPNYIREAFFSAFAEMTDYRIIFVYNGPTSRQYEHILLLKYAPQKEILNDNRTKLLISHGGLNSIKEAICASIPVLYMPIYAEQGHNVLVAKELGLGEALNKMEVSKEKIVEAVRKVIYDPKYKGNVQRVKNMFLDRPMNPIDHALFVSQRIKTHQHNVGFKRKGVGIPWIQHLFFDAVFIILCSVAVVTR